MLSNNADNNSPLTLGDLLAALSMVSKKGPSCSLQVGQLQNVTCSIGKGVQRGAQITNAFHIKDIEEYLELEYVVSPPGSRDAKMSNMELQFSFSGNADGHISIFLNRPQRFRPQGFYKFGLGVAEIQQGCDAHHKFCVVSFPKDQEIHTLGDNWVGFKLDGENLMGGLLKVTILAKYPCHGILSVHLSASTYDEDPKPEVTDAEEWTEHATRKWNSRAYQREVLGGETMELYLEH